ncbi:MAG TPA: OB-fold nucleic acid binding domain-containing protein, partial [Verrucomicrobiae bacterium]|nr:OB-fold nucleic acid binding domain-containing protein [Verrucomicrobiae bacterium]
VGCRSANGSQSGETAVAPVQSLPMRPIRFGLAAIKNVGEATVQSVLKGRDQNGRFKSLPDLCERVETRALNRKVLEALIKCGACDCFGQTRATMFSHIDRALARAAGIQSDRQRGQSSLFGSLEERPEASSGTADAEKGLPEWPQHELLAYEKELLGFYVTGHPLTPYVPLLKKYALANTAQLAGLDNRSMTRIGGLIAAVQNGVSKKSGKPYSMVTLEDLEGTVQILCMNENYEKYRSLLQLNKAVLVTGEVNTGDERPKIFPQEIIAIEEAPKKFTKQVHLRLQAAHLEPGQLESVRDLVVGHPGKCPLFLCFMQPAGEVQFVQANDRFAVMPSLDLQHEADARFGEGTYYAKVDTALPERQSRWPRKNGTNEE